MTENIKHADIEGMLGAASAPISRRSFIVSTSIAAGYALAAGPVNAQAISTSSEGLVEGNVGIQVTGGTMPAYSARPANMANPPLVIVAIEIFGVHEYIRDVCRRLAKLGVMAVAPDVYFRKGDLSKISDTAQIMPIVMATPDAQLMSDYDATVRWATGEGAKASAVGMIGYCRGGRSVWLYTAHNPSLKAAVAWYGPLAGPLNDLQPTWPINVADKIKVPVLGLYGGADTGIPLESVERMKAALAAAGSPSKIVVFPDAPHGFHADYRSSYRSGPAEESWKMMQDWFRANGVMAR